MAITDHNCGNWKQPYRRVRAIIGMVLLLAATLSLLGAGCQTQLRGVHIEYHKSASSGKTPAALLSRSTPPPPSGLPIRRTGQEFAYTAINNGILQFRILKSGRLSPLSPPVAVVSQSVTDLTADPRGRCLYYTLYGTNIIAGFYINLNGTLKTPDGFNLPVSGKVTSMAATPNGCFLYAATDSGDIDQFDIQGSGSLKFHSRVSPLNQGSEPTIAIESSGRFLYYGHNANLGQMRIGRDGTLTPLSPSIADSGNFTQILPVPGDQFVYAMDGNGYSEWIRQYRIHENGTLGLLTHKDIHYYVTFLISYPRKPYLYASGSFGKVAVWKFAILPNGLLKRPPIDVSSSAHISREPETSVDVSIDPTGRFAYVTENDFTKYPYPATQITQCRIEPDGSLSKITPSATSFGHAFGAPVIVRR